MNNRLNKRLKELKIVDKNKEEQIPHGWRYYCMEVARLENITRTHYGKGTGLRNVVAKVLLMYIKDHDISEIIEETKLSKSSVYNYISKYKSNKNFIYDIGRKPKQTICSLEPYEFKIVVEFEKNHISSYKEAQECIFKITGIRRTIPRIYTFLTKHNFKKINGYYIQETTEKTIVKRLQYEKQFLNENIDEIKKFINDYHLHKKRGLASKIRKEFGIKYTSEYHLREYIRKKQLSGY